MNLLTMLLILPVSLSAGVTLFEASDNEITEKKGRNIFRSPAAERVSVPKEQKKEVYKKRNTEGLVKGNLPKHQIPSKSFKSYTGGKTYYPKKPSKNFLDGVWIGQEAIVQFDRKLIGYPGSKVPVAAKLRSGLHKGSVMFGHASMSKTTKRLLLNFSVLTTPKGEEYKVNADLLSADGTLGIPGDIHSNKVEMFGLDLIFSAFKGYSEASKERNTTVLGAEYSKNNRNNAEKGAISEASQASINRVRNEFLKAEEYVVSDEIDKAVIIFNQKPFKL